MKKTLIALLAAVMAAGTATVMSAAQEETADYVTIGEFTKTATYPASTEKWPEVTSGQLLTGKIIASPLADAERAVNLFDGDKTTATQVGYYTWVGIELDQAYQLTEVRYAPDPGVGNGPGGWFVLQASNDGIRWTQIIKMYQDAVSQDYHIFSPQTIKDERYTAAGYKKKQDESIHWLDDGGSYSMYRICSNCLGDVEFYGNAAPATDISTDDLLALRNIATPYYTPFIVHERDAQIKNSVDGSLVGTIIGSGTLWGKAYYEQAFDNKATTHFDPGLEGCEVWVGLKFDEPHAFTEVRLLPKRVDPTAISAGHIQGSLDGHNWVDLALIEPEDVSDTAVWITKKITDPKGYTYIRYVSANEQQSCIAELLFYGAPAEAAEPFTVEPTIASQHKFTGPLYYAPEKNTVEGDEISGTPISGDYYFGWRDPSYDRDVSNAFDNDLSKGYGVVARLNGPQYWMGLMADEPTIVGEVKYAPDNGIFNYTCPIFFQGSVDGINWVDLTTFENTDVIGDDGYITKTISNGTVFGYFRLYIDGYFPVEGLSCAELKIYAGEAPAETEAPETAAPETEAPVFFVPTEGTVELTTVGNVITSTTNDVTAIYDSDVTTTASLGGAGNGCWFGVELAQPAILDCVRVSATDTDGDGISNRPWTIFKTVVEGSNDGETWEQIMYLGDPYSEYEDYAYWYELGNNYFIEYAFDGESDEDDDMTDAVAYKYYRVWNDDGGDDFAEVEFWATLVEEEPEYLLGDITGDNSVDILDAVLLFQHSMMPEAYPVSYAGNLDVTKDGNIDIKDAVLLFQYSMMPEVYPIA